MVSLDNLYLSCCANDVYNIHMYFNVFVNHVIRLLNFDGYTFDKVFCI